MLLVGASRIEHVTPAEVLQLCPYRLRCSGYSDETQNVPGVYISEVPIEAGAVEYVSRCVEELKNVSFRGASGHHNAVRPSNIDLAHVGTFCQEMAERDPLVSRAKALQLRLAKHHQQGMLNWYVMDCRWLSRVCYAVCPAIARPAHEGHAGHAR